MTNSKIIPIRDIGTNAAIKTALVTHLVSMGLDWLTVDSSWDDIFKAIDIIGSIGFDVPITEIVNRAITLSSITNNLSVSHPTETAEVTIFNREDFGYSDLNVTRSISISSISLNLSKSVTESESIITENNDITVAVIDNPLATMNVSDTHQLTWAGSTTLGTTIIVTDWVFTSSFANITVSDTGLVTAVDVGEATIRMESRADSGIYDEYSVTVS